MPKDQVERDRGSDYFGEIARRDGYLAAYPEQKADRPGVVVAARLREIASGDDAELRCESLEQDRHQVRGENDAQQRVAELRSTREIGCPVARIHVADSHQVSRSRECEDLAPPSLAGDGEWFDRPRPVREWCVPVAILAVAEPAALVWAGEVSGRAGSPKSDSWNY